MTLPIGQAVEVVINENNHAQCSGEQLGTFHRLDLFPCPVAVSTGTAGNGHNGNQSAEQCQKENHSGVSTNLVCHNAGNIHNSIQHRSA